jgi:four helix bundle protein
MQTYRDLIVWQKSIELVTEIYRVTKMFPSEEKFGISNQMRKCAVSIPSNIAEGYARRNRKENAQFINIAFGSATELETQIIISKKLNFVNETEWQRSESLLREVLSMLYRYRETLYTN